MEENWSAAAMLRQILIIFSILWNDQDTSFTTNQTHIQHNCWKRMNKKSTSQELFNHFSSFVSYNALKNHVYWPLTRQNDRQFTGLCNQNWNRIKLPDCFTLCARQQDSLIWFNWFSAATQLHHNVMYSHDDVNTKEWKLTIKLEQVSFKTQFCPTHINGDLW
jgi:hypothetical protein